MPVGTRFLNVVEFIWSHIFEQCSRRKGASRRGACAQKSYFGRTFGGVYKFWNFFLSWANQSGSLQIIIINWTLGCTTLQLIKRWLMKIMPKHWCFYLVLNLKECSPSVTMTNGGNFMEHFIFYFLLLWTWRKRGIALTWWDAYYGRNCVMEFFRSKTC
jgi:hypothetical protein